MTTHDPIRFVAKNMRVDLRLIAEMIAPGTRVLDIGSGDGSLIEHLFRTKGCDARGIEIDMVEVIRSVAYGLPVMHGDADTDLTHYPDGAFDYVVLSRTLQAVEQPRAVLPQFRPLAVANATFHPRTNADDGDLGPGVVRDAEHPSLYHPRLLRSVCGRGLRGRALAGGRRRRKTGAMAAISTPRESVRRAGLVPAAAQITIGR
jgi:SAM-dependent methyltransferase